MRTNQGSRASVPWALLAMLPAPGGSQFDAGEPYDDEGASTAKPEWDSLVESMVRLRPDLTRVVKEAYESGLTEEAVFVVACEAVTRRERLVRQRSEGGISTRMLQTAQEVQEELDRALGGEGRHKKYVTMLRAGTNASSQLRHPADSVIGLIYKTVYGLDKDELNLTSALCHALYMCAAPNSAAAAYLWPLNREPCSSDYLSIAIESLRANTSLVPYTSAETAPESNPDEEWARAESLIRQNLSIPHDEHATHLALRTGY